MYAKKEEKPQDVNSLSPAGVGFHGFESHLPASSGFFQEIVFLLSKSKRSSFPSLGSASSVLIVYGAFRLVVLVTASEFKESMKKTIMKCA